MKIPESTTLVSGLAGAGEQSLADVAYATLEEMIVTLKLAPGSAVSESTLSKLLNIGRTPIREALQRLARDYLVNILPRRGIIVSEINIRQQLKMLEVRREIDRLLATAAARRANEAERVQFQEIADCLDRVSREKDEMGFVRLDRDFNLLLAQASRNEFAASSMEPMQALSRRFWYIHFKQVGDLPLISRLHADVCRAIAGGDPKKAGAASDRLLDYIEEFTRATVSVDV
jgi:DNA-binding GntR family transcriptional regulator